MFRQSILIRVRQSGDQSQGWLCCRARGPDLSCSAERAEELVRQHWPSETSFGFYLSLCPSSLAAICIFFLLYLSHLQLSILMALYCLGSVSPPPSHYSFLLILLSENYHLSSVVLFHHPLSSPSFSHPQFNSWSFIGIIR